MEKSVLFRLGRSSRNILAVVVLFLATTVSLRAQTNGQTTERHFYNWALGIGHNAADSSRWRSANVGILAATDTLHGFQIGGISSIAHHQMKGVNIGGLFAAGGGRIDGLQAAFGMNTLGGEMRGMQLAGISNVARHIHGVQLSGFANIVGTPFRGLQLSAFTNIAMGIKAGVQIGGIANITSKTMRGLQLGTYNYADTLRGAQIGLVNIALQQPKGLQLGIINYSRDTLTHKIGLINISPQTEIDVLAYWGNYALVNMALRFRNRNTYSLLSVGTRYMGFTDELSGAVSYRLGRYLNLSPRWLLSGDIGFAHIETFEKETSDKPHRLYSLQGRVNLDYHINKKLGVFVSAGWGTTHYYGHNEHYRNKLLLEAGIVMRFKPENTQSYGGTTGTTERSMAERYKMLMENDSTLHIHNLQFAYNDPKEQRKRPWKASAEATAVNVLVHCVDRFVFRYDFAKVNFKSIHNNFKNGFVWDNDKFSTNLFAHPYHGSLYYNSARGNGLSFWESAPYALGGSLMWEFMGEVEPPAINDVLATTVGGICFGEISHRISHLLLNDRSRGFRRFLREFGAAIINPMGGFNRIVTGKAWHVKNEYYKYHDYETLPIDLSISLGGRYLADNGAMFRGDYNSFFNIFLEYGDPLNRATGKPYDFFSMELSLGLGGNQPFVNGIHILGRLWGAPVFTGTNLKAQVGIFQHFNYYDSDPVKEGSKQTPYRISEAASFGPGVVISFLNMGGLAKLEQRVFLSGILLGGTKSDYYNVIDRDYNMGSGFSVKTKTFMEFHNFGRFVMHAAFYHIYTRKGYDKEKLATTNPLYLNAQGDKGNADLLVLNPIWEFDFNKRMSVVLSGSYYIRNTRYAYYNNVHAETFEVKMGVAYHF
ncbi:DUF3943 domain-containing protein [Prevotella falsenii]|uniref:DUF3943 domain-containing protein n=1 Tax=Prevotella falsenii TaxID=515414 RepID=UPI00046AC5E5